MSEACVLMDPLRATFSLNVWRFHSYRTVNISRLGYNKTADDVLRDVAHRLERGILYFRNIVPFYGAHGDKKSAAVPAPVFTQPTNSQQQYMHIS